MTWHSSKFLLFLKMHFYVPDEKQLAIPQSKFTTKALGMSGKSYIFDDKE